MFLVVWTSEDEEGQLHDSWSAHDSLGEARKRYFTMLGSAGLYSASLCSVLMSTDYGMDQPAQPTVYWPQKSPGHRAKVTIDQIRAIRWLYELGVPQKTLASQFGLSVANVSLIVNGHRWTYVSGPIKKKKEKA